MEAEEARDIVISAVALALAFAIAFTGIEAAVQRPLLLTEAFIIALALVSTSFIFHEMAHRFVAKRRDCHAAYKMWPQGIVLALAFSLFGFVFAAPGAVMIYPRADIWGNVRSLSKKAHGMIAMAGPAVNIALAFIFLAAASLFQSFAGVLTFGFRVNIWLALFNLLPVPPLDGYAAFSWDKKIWASLFAVCIGLFFL